MVILFFFFLSIVLLISFQLRVCFVVMLAVSARSICCASPSVFIAAYICLWVFLFFFEVFHYFFLFSDRSYAWNASFTLFLGFSIHISVAVLFFFCFAFSGNSWDDASLLAFLELYVSVTICPSSQCSSSLFCTATVYICFISGFERELQLSIAFWWLFGIP